MKHKQAIVVLSAVLILSNTATAQKDSSGIYKTADDFKNRKLSYAINYKTENHKIKLLFSYYLLSFQNRNNINSGINQHPAPGKAIP